MKTRRLYKTLFLASRRLYNYYPKLLSCFFLWNISDYVAEIERNSNKSDDNFFRRILLCTCKGKKMVEYALAGMDNQLFVSTYMLQLPDKATLEKFLQGEINNHDLRDE